MVTFCLPVLLIVGSSPTASSSRRYSIDDRPTPAVSSRRWTMYQGKPGASSCASEHLAGPNARRPVRPGPGGVFVDRLSAPSGGVHDFLSGMMSATTASPSPRSGLSGKVTFIMWVFSVVPPDGGRHHLLRGPRRPACWATPTCQPCSGWWSPRFTPIATFLPIDKIIGKLTRVRHLPHHHGPGHRRGYITRGSDMPELTAGLHRGAPRQPPKWSMMFVTVSLRRHLTTPPSPHDGPLHHQREAGPHHLLRRHGEASSPDLGRRRRHLLHQPRLLLDGTTGSTNAIAGGAGDVPDLHHPARPRGRRAGHDRRHRSFYHLA